jgi:hypothetical protein
MHLLYVNKSGAFADPAFKDFAQVHPDIVANGELFENNALGALVRLRRYHQVLACFTAPGAKVRGPEVLFRQSSRLCLIT